ncbi:MAG TPA: efflux RND transporter periplasmic adaptor subunit, partial [Candidatus Tectomicrobia bacterium]
MNGKTMLLLVLVAVGGITLGAVGMWYFGAWEGGAHAEYDNHAGHSHRENKSGQNTTGTPSPQADSHTHGKEPASPAAATGAHPPRKAAHGHHGAVPSGQTNAKGAYAAKTDTHGHDEHAHGHDEERMVRMTADQAQQLGIKVEATRGGGLRTSLILPGTIALNTDRRVHVVSRIPGIVQEIRKQLGDTVRAGEVMAVIDSRELADTKATYLAARERLSLAETTFAREKDLWEKKISPEEDYLKARQALAEGRIEAQVAVQKLRALGLSEAYIQQLAARVSARLTRYEVIAPLAGTVIEKHIAIGETLKDDTEAFMVADLSTVWVDLNIAVKDLALVRKGQRVVIAADAALLKAEGTVSYVSPVVSDETRTAVTRVVLPNPDGRWRPGLFVTATLIASETPVARLIPKTALQTIDGQPTVFVQTLEGFAPRPVTLGRANETHVEITAGLEAGEPYAA